MNLSLAKLRDRLAHIEAAAKLLRHRDQDLEQPGVKLARLVNDETGMNLYLVALIAEDAQRQDPGLQHAEQAHVAWKIFDERMQYLATTPTTKEQPT